MATADHRDVLLIAGDDPYEFREPRTSCIRTSDPPKRAAASAELGCRLPST
jgi:hypothetical protein